MKRHEVDTFDEWQSFRTSLLRLIEALSVDFSEAAGGAPASDVWGGAGRLGEAQTS